MYRASYSSINSSKDKDEEDTRRAETNAEIIINEGLELSQGGHKFEIPTINVNFWKTIPVVKHAALDTIMDKILDSGGLPINNRIYSSFESDQQFYVNDIGEIVLNGNVRVSLTLLNVNKPREYYGLRTKFSDNKIVYPYELASGSSPSFKSYYFNGKQGFLLLSDMIICYIVNDDNTEDVYKFYLPYPDRDHALRFKFLHERYPYLTLLKNMHNNTVSDDEKITSFIEHLVNYGIFDFKFKIHYKFNHNTNTTTVIAENKHANPLMLNSGLLPVKSFENLSFEERRRHENIPYQPKGIVSGNVIGESIMQDLLSDDIFRSRRSHVTGTSRVPHTSYPRGNVD